MLPMLLNSWCIRESDSYSLTQILVWYDWSSFSSRITLPSSWSFPELYVQKLLRYFSVYFSLRFFSFLYRKILSLSKTHNRTSSSIWYLSGQSGKRAIFKFEEISIQSIDQQGLVPIFFLHLPYTSWSASKILRNKVLMKRNNALRKKSHVKNPCKQQKLMLNQYDLS